MKKSNTIRVGEESVSPSSVSGLETIAVRVADRDDLMKVMEFCTRFFDTVSSEEQGCLSAFRSAEYESDFSIHIQRQLDPARVEKGLLGLQLAHGLSQFGIINHTLWINQDILMK